MLSDFTVPDWHRDCKPTSAIRVILVNRLTCLRCLRVRWLALDFLVAAVDRHIPKVGVIFKPFKIALLVAIVSSNICVARRHPTIDDKGLVWGTGNSVAGTIGLNWAWTVHPAKLS